MPISMAPDNGRVNRVSKLVVNPWTGPIPCCWDTCDRLATTAWPVRLHEHPPHWPCDYPFSQHAFMTFCSEGHRDYWLWCSGWRAKETAARNHGLIYGMAPEGSKLGRYR